MKEAELQKLVLHQARLDGWNVAHFGNSVKFVRRGAKYITVPDRDAAGFLDLVMVREERLIFAELKSEKGRITDAQALWLADLRRVAQMTDNVFDDNSWPIIRVYVWRPPDWLDGSIQAVLE